MEPEAIYTGPIYDPETRYSDFRKQIEDLINTNSMENGSNTPDWILAEYLTDCLKVFDKTVKNREKWYGRF